MKVGGGEVLKKKEGGRWGDVLDIAGTALTINVQKGPKQAGNHPTAVFAHTFVQTGVLEDAIYEIGEHIAAEKPDAVAKALLLALPPNLRTGSLAPQNEERAVEFAVRIVGDLDATILAVQGPPGSGKTFTGSEM